MRRIMLIVLSFLFILTGCSSSSAYTKENLANYDYILNESENTMYKTWDNSSVFVSFDYDQEPVAIGIDYAPTSYQSLELKYVLADDMWYAYYTSGGESTNIEVNDLYAYLKVMAPEAVDELFNFVEAKSISTSELEGGNSEVIDTLLIPDLTVSSLKVTDSGYTNLAVTDNYFYNAYYISVNFDLTNNTDEDIDLSSAKLEVCYVSNSGSECANLETLEDNDTDLTNKILKPNETYNIQMNAAVPTDASSFEIRVSINDKTISTASETVEKSN